MEKCFKGSGSERRGRKGRRRYEAKGIEFGRASESRNGEGNMIVMSGLRSVQHGLLKSNSRASTYSVHYFPKNDTGRGSSRLELVSDLQKLRPE